MAIDVADGVVVVADDDDDDDDIAAAGGVVAGNRNRNRNRNPLVNNILFSPGQHQQPSFLSCYYLLSCLLLLPYYFLPYYFLILSKLPFMLLDTLHLAKLKIHGTTCTFVFFTS